MLEPILDPRVSRFNTVIAAGVEEAYQPIRGAQATAADVENPRLRAKALTQQRDKLPAPCILKSLDGYT